MTYFKGFRYLFITGLAMQLGACGSTLFQKKQSNCEARISRSYGLANSNQTKVETWETGSNPYNRTPVISDGSLGDDVRDVSMSKSDPCVSVGAASAGPEGIASEPVTADSAMSSEASSGKSASPGDASSGTPTSPGSWTTGGQTREIGPGILTAGNFDDALNLSSFLAFWKDKNPQSLPYEEQILSADSVPSVDQLQLPQRWKPAPYAALDLSLIIDTTGSMGDELAYINAEIKYISSAIKLKYPNVKQRFSLIVYRDDGDAYITRGMQFTEDLSLFQSFLSEQSAGGGGDYPEALHVALSEANSKLQWGDASVAKVAFLIADAPAHNQHLSASFDALHKLRDKGVHVYPVAASGVGHLAEKIMRYAALTSGGEYLFLTDDSGVGNPHAKPHIPCYQVQKLNDLMIHMLSQEVEQKRFPVPSDKVLRTVGKSEAGVCL